MLQSKLKEAKEEKQVTSPRTSKSPMAPRAKKKKDPHPHFSGGNTANATMTMTHNPESAVPKAPLHQINVGLGLLNGHPEELNHPSSGKSKGKSTVSGNPIANKGNQIIGTFVAYGLQKPNFGSQPP